MENKIYHIDKAQAKEYLKEAKNNQGKIVAYDLFEHKIKLVKDNLKRLGVNNVELHAGDAVLLKDQYPKAIFDKILYCLTLAL